MKQVKSGTPLLVVLDLDQTLIYSSTKKEGVDSDPFVKEVHFENEEFFTQKRPGVELFLKSLFSDDRFVPAVWTTATDDYARYILQNLEVDVNRLHFLWSRKHCVRSYQLGEDGHSSYGLTQYIKDLRKATKRHPWPLERIITVDDIASMYSRQYSNLLVAPAFKGEEVWPGFFTRLWRYLEFLGGLENVRPHEKRGWLTQPL